MFCLRSSAVSEFSPVQQQETIGFNRSHTFHGSIQKCHTVRVQLRFHPKVKWFIIVACERNYHSAHIYRRSRSVVAHSPDLSISTCDGSQTLTPDLRHAMIDNMRRRSVADFDGTRNCRFLLLKTTICGVA